MKNLLRWDWWKYHCWPPYRKRVDEMVRSLIIPGLVDEILESNPLIQMLMTGKPDREEKE